jgi:2-desacetyl-2-hydroxyethyl bacteriochlorophyllide A dehydrogenase
MSNAATMDALLIERYGEVALARVPLPDVTDDTVLARVHYSGISIGTEMLLGTGTLGPKPLPFVPGYQAAGEIVALGRNVQGLAIGDPVAFFNRTGSHGAYAATTPELVHRLARREDCLLASLFVQPSVGANALDLLDVRAGESVLVVGQGLIGQATAQLARLRGAFVAASDLSPPRLALSAAHCADWTIDAAAAPVHQQTAARFPRGFDVVIETTGSDRVLEDSLRCTAYGGRYAFLGYHPGLMQFPFDFAHRKELRAVFPFFIGKPPVREGVLRLLASGALNLRPLIDHIVPYADVQPLYQRLFTPARDAVNAITIDWRGAAPSV